MGRSITDYTRVCTDCAAHKLTDGHHVCHAACNVVTGDSIRFGCTFARSDRGPCGPGGRLYAPSEIVGAVEDLNAVAGRMRLIRSK